MPTLFTVPKEALDLAVGVWYGVEPDEVDPDDTKAAEGDMRAALEAAAPLIMAAELERLVNLWEQHHLPSKYFTASLRQRAAELRGGGTAVPAAPESQARRVVVDLPKPDSADDETGATWLIKPWADDPYGLEVHAVVTDDGQPAVIVGDWRHHVDHAEAHALAVLAAVAESRRRLAAQGGATPTAANSPHLIPGRWYREHPPAALVAELKRRGLPAPAEPTADDIDGMAKALNDSDAANETRV